MATVTAFIRTSVKSKTKSNVRFRLTDGRGGNPETIIVPLSDKAKQIIAKYSHIKDRRLIPFPYDQKYNRDLKDVFKKAGITRTVHG